MNTNRGEFNGPVLRDNVMFYRGLSGKLLREPFGTQGFWMGDWRLGIAEERVAMAKVRLARAEAQLAKALELEASAT